jgi:hypothetical protein
LFKVSDKQKKLAYFQEFATGKCPVFNHAAYFLPGPTRSYLAAYFILTHNHPHFIVCPSQSKFLSKILVAAMKTFQEIEKILQTNRKDLLKRTAFSKSASSVHAFAVNKSRGATLIYWLKSNGLPVS